MIKYLLFFFLFIVSLSVHSQYIPDMLAEDVILPYPPTPYLKSSRPGSSEAFYLDLNNWIPYGILAPNEPLKNPPLTIIDIALHVFLDNNGGNCSFSDNPQGRSDLIWGFNLLNQIYEGFAEHNNNYQKGTSNPIPGLIELPDCDTRIRFSLGENNERIYFYKNSTLNADAGSAFPFINYINTYYPERSHTLNIFFSAGTYGTAGGYASLPSFTYLDQTQYVVICKANQSINGWILGSALFAHELGHSLSLVHTYCGGGSSVICCSGSCDQGCPKTTNTSEYMSDIFGPISNSTCPHLALWVNPFDKTHPNADKLTNNVMGGTEIQRYFSPMQAGMMHKALALSSARKYVRKETYSPMPLVINSSEIWDFNLKLYRDVVVSPGSTLTIATMFEFPYNGTITVNNGATLVIEKSVKLYENNKIIVQAGGTLQLDPNSTTEVHNNGYIEIQSGANCNVLSGSTLTVMSGGALHLKNASQFSVELGATMTIEPGAVIEN